MRTLYESILDADFVDRSNGLDIMYDFIKELQQFKPKNEAEAYTYWLAIRKAFYYIMVHMNNAGDTVYTNKLKLQMLGELVRLPGKVEVPYYKVDDEEWGTFSTEDPWFADLIDKHYADIEKNKFIPWCSNYSSGNLMHTFFDAEGGYEVDPDSLPEETYNGFDEKKYENIKKKIYNIAQRFVNELKHI